MNQPLMGSAEFFTAKQPDAIAFFDGDERITWRQWNTRADRLAAAFIAQGIAAGDRIATRLGTRHEWFIVQLAASKIGAALVGINNRATVQEADYLLEDCGAKALVIDDADPEPIVAVARNKGIDIIVSFTRMVGAAHFAALIADDVPAKPFISRAPAPLILYTSGTTGRPKGVALDPALLARRENVQAYREYMANVAPMTPNSRFLLSLPMHHAAGPNSSLFCLRAGGSVVVQTKFDAEAFLELIDRFRVTNWTAVPTMIHRLAALPHTVAHRFDRSSLRAINIGAAAVPLNLKLWSKEFFGPQCSIIEGYGMSETQMISYLLPDDWAIAPNSSGKPIPYVEVRIVGPTGTTLGPNEPGEICARTPLTIDRYLNRPPFGPDELTPDGLFRTGDVGYLDENGYLYVTDRLKDMFIVGGTNVYPAEIEAVLNTHPDIIEAAVIGIPHPELGEQGLALCEMKPGAARDPQAIIEHCRKSLASYKVPKLVEFVEELPRNPTGKVMKAVLREPYWAGRERKV